MLAAAVITMKDADLTPMLHIRAGSCLNIKTVLPGMGIPMLGIKQSWDRLMPNTGIPMLVRHIF